MISRRASSYVPELDSSARASPRPDLIPDFTPDHGGGLSQCCGMFATDNLTIRVVVEVDELIAPPDEHGLTRGEHDPHCGLQTLRPRSIAPQRRPRPVGAANVARPFRPPLEERSVIRSFGGHIAARRNDPASWRMGLSKRKGRNASRVPVRNMASGRP